MKIVVKVHPRSKRTQVKQNSSGVYHIYVTQPAVEDKANAATVKTLADFLQISPNRLILEKGRTSREKTFIILSPLDKNETK